MKSFWWFKENSIAGMARPGFNASHWFDLPFDEAVLVGWLGKFSSGLQSRAKFNDHLKTYAPKIFKFYGLDEVSGTPFLENLADSVKLNAVFERMNQRTGIFESFTVTDQHLEFTLSESRIRTEVEFLKNQGVRRIVSLTENHHHQGFLQEHFELHHIGIEDLGAPQVEQVHELAEVIRSSRANQEILAVHCLAGIGRTSTMLMAAHLLLGENFAELEARLKKQNPTFILTGPQGSSSGHSLIYAVRTE